MADVIGEIEVQLSGNDAGLTAAFTKARSVMSALESEMARLTAEEKKGAIATADYAAKMTELEAAHKRVAAAMSASASRASTLNVAMAGAQGGVKNFGMGVLMVSQGIEDLQYGIAAVVNNVPGIAMAFGAGAGVAGAMSLAAVATSQFIKHWEWLEDHMGMGFAVPALEGLEKFEARLKEVDKRLTELREQKRLSLPETGELRTLTEERTTLKAKAEAEKDLEKVTGGRSKEDQARGAAFAEAVAESGGKIALESLADALKNQANAAGKVGVLGAEVDTPRKVAEELFRNAAKGDEAARASIRSALGPAHPFAGRIEELSPETKARREAEDRFESEGVKRAQEAEKKRLAALDREEEDHKKSNRAADRIDEDLHKEALGRLAGVKEANKRREEENEGATALFFQTEEDRLRLTERGSDLDWRLRQLMGPSRPGQSLGLEAYEASIKSGGENAQEKRLHAIQEILEERLINQRDLKLIGVKRTRG